MKLIQAVLVMLLFSVSSHLMSLDIGDKAPGFTLEATDGKTYSLDQFLNKEAVVIAWYPKAFTGGCTVECKSLADNGHLLKDLEVAYFMASIDPIEKNIKFALDNDADFPLLSDPTKEVAKKYDVLHWSGLYSERHTIYISKEGRIEYVDTQVNPGTSAEDMAAKLVELGVQKRTTS